MSILLRAKASFNWSILLLWLAGFKTLLFDLKSCDIDSVYYVCDMSLSAVGLLINTILAVQANSKCDDRFGAIDESDGDSDSILRYWRLS